MLGKVFSIILSLVVLLVSYVYYNNLHLTRSPVVTTKGGLVQGVTSVSRGGHEFYEYLGIPFTKPPVNDLRFEPPQLADPWDGIKDASKYSNFCIQFEFFVLGLTIGSEDCLYLNVFVPKTFKKDPIPVMVYFHGGYFHLGSSEVAGPNYIMGEGLGVILVTINYRLGALGFLNTGDGLIRGNMGLKDQNMGLHWVQDNIRAFGGDPKKVTIFGESAGGVSGLEMWRNVQLDAVGPPTVHHHVLSPKSKGLFWRAIHQSGSSLNYWGVYRNVEEQSQRFAKKFDCPVDNTETMTLCLKQVDARTLVSQHEELMNFFRTRISTFAPSIEFNDSEAFIVEEPLEILKSGRFNKVPMMTGLAANEGLLVSSLLKVNQTKLNEANDDWDTWSPRVLHYSNDLKQVTAKIKKFYFGDGNFLINDTKYLQNFTNLLGDRLFNIGVSRSARLQSKFVQTYLYYNDHQGEFSIPSILTSREGPFHWIVNFIIGRAKSMYYRHILNEDLPHWGACHAEELRLLFSGKFLEYFLFEMHRDTDISKDVVKLWTDFAKDVKPLKFRNLEWPAIKNDFVKVLRISNDPAVIDDPLEDRLKLWESLEIPAH